MTSIRTVPATLTALLALTTFAATCADDASTPPGPDDPGTPPATGTPVVQGGVRYEADVAVMESFPVQLAGRVTMTNVGDRSVDLVFPDGCLALLRAYRDGGRVWDQSSEIACTMVLIEMTLATGESRTVQAPTVSAYEILGDDLPDGDYEIRVYVRPNGGEVEISAGTTALAIPRN